MKKSTMIVIGVIVVAILWAVSAYNGMVGKQESATTALANVQATYQRRADLLPNLQKPLRHTPNMKRKLSRLLLRQELRLLG